tara:strand:+ start:35 stop:604 length:570 start_codon:yes stop_codon:yes gene_type:complete
VKKFLVPLLCLSSGTVLASESNCDYKTNVNTDFQGTISSSKNYNKTTYPHVEDTRKCIIKLDVKINEAWYPTSGTYVFGPDMTENAACKRAEVRAKETILREVVPEKLNRTMNQNCAVHVRTVPVKKAPVPKAEIKKVAVYSSGMWKESGWKNVYTPLTKGCLHSNTPSKVVWINGSKQFAYKEVCKVK